MYLCARGIDFTSFYDFSIEYWNCSDNGVFFVFHFIFAFLLTLPGHFLIHDLLPGL
jgi:hypothetical protein